MELNELGLLLKRRLERKRHQIESFRDKEIWAKCLELEGQIIAIESVWEDLMQRELLTDKGE